MGEAPGDDNSQEQIEKGLKRKRVGSSEIDHQESVMGEASDAPFTPRVLGDFSSEEQF